MNSDFHIHSIFSDGELIPSEIAERYNVNGFDAIAITDHIDFSNLDSIEKLKRIQGEINNPRVIIGAELTFTPINKIDKLAEMAIEKGAELLVMHGETPVEPVPKGTNIKAIESGYIDILAHPGYIDEETAIKARENNVYLEITSRHGHNITNGHVVKKATEHGAPLIINSDAHKPRDLLTKERIEKVGKGAGITKEHLEKVKNKNPEKIIEKIDN